MGGVYIDIETYSSYNLPDVGMHRYVEAPDFEVQLLAYAGDEGPVQQVDLQAGEQLPEWLEQYLLSGGAGGRKYAVNAPFEIVCLFEHFYRLGKLNSRSEPAKRRFIHGWYDTALLGRYAGVGGSLAGMGKALRLDAAQAKSRAGEALIRFFAMPRKPSAKNPTTRNLPENFPEKWQEYKDYNRQDVVAEREIHRALPNIQVPEFVQWQWEQDTLLNWRGVALDKQMITNAIQMDAEYSEALISEAQQITGLDNPNSRAQLLPWLEGEKVEMPGLTKVDVSNAKADIQDDDELAHAHRMLEIRQELAKASISKYTRANACMGEDGRARGLLQFYGADRTGRWAGRLIQVQNLPRLYLKMYAQKMGRKYVIDNNPGAIQMLFESLPDTLSQLIRTCFIPGPGFRFVDADYSAIEARVIAWYAGEEWVLDVFRTHGKIYEATASQMFDIPLDTIKRGHANYSYRSRGKVATLALGFQGGTGALIKMGALRDGIPEEDLPGIVKLWRKANPNIVKLWRSIETAAIQAVQTPNTPIGTNRLTFYLDTTNPRGIHFLVVQLPSGRRLHYAYPELQPGKYGLQLVYMQQKDKAFMQNDTYGGKLTENIVQATARDILAEAIVRIEGAGLRPVFHVHDELVCELPVHENADIQLEQLRALMSINPSWAQDLPLNAEGWTGEFFTKD